MIHKTAIVDKKAKISAKAIIGPYSIVGPNVEIGEGAEIQSHVNITGNTIIGNNTKIFPFASVGTNPQDLKFRGEKTRLKIGSNNIIREHVTINTGTDGGGGITKIGNDNLIMIGAHIAHDCIIGNNVVIAGDWNTAHFPIDLANPKANEKNSGFMPVERAQLDEYVENGYVDTFRLFHDEPERYSWWTYRFGARQRNIGWRIDYFFVNEGFVESVADADIHEDVMGSDHCPVSIELVDNF